MRRRACVWLLAVGMAVAGAAAETAAGTAPAAPAGQAAPAAEQAAVAGGRLHGVVKSAATVLPGVTVTAQNTLTGKRVSTTTDISGAWTLTLAQNGRYVIRTQFAGFAPGAQEAVLNTASHDAAVNFDLLLASRAAKLQAAEAASPSGNTAALLQSGLQAIQQLAGNGAQNLNLQSALDAGVESQNGTAGTQTGAALPAAASNTDFSTDSVAVSGQSGTVSPLAGVDMDRLRDALETLRSQGIDLGGQGGNFGGGGGLFGGGGFGGPGGFGGGPGGGRGNFRGFNPGQPHGAVFWMGSNAALNAEPFSLNGQPQAQPASGSNRFGITFMSAPYLPGWTKPSGKDTLFLTLSGNRTSSPSDQYATVPTNDERAGNLAGLGTLYNQAANYAPYTNNQIPVASQAAALLAYFPQSNLTTTANGYNYHLLTTAQSNSTQAGVRYMRSLGKNAVLPGGLGGRGSGSGRRSQSLGLRQSISLNYNWSDSASDSVNVFPQLGGKNASGSNSVQAGYTLGYHKITSIFNANWNRANSHTTNFFTNGTDIATQVGILGPGGIALNSNPIDYGLPNIQITGFTGFSQVQPSFSISQTLSFSETLSWIHKKHNLRFGGDYRRVHRDFLGGSTSTGAFTFSGKFTEDQAGDATTGSALADFLLGFPQETTLDVAASKSYLRDNVTDLYAQDDWRATSKLTLNFGLRYEFFAPYTEKNGHLAMVNTNPAGGFTSESEVQAGSAGLPRGLVYPQRTAFAPRFGLAFRAPKQTVLRAGYGMNYTVGQYGTFASTMARQPMVNQPTFIDQQTNEATVAGFTATGQPLTLASGFITPVAGAPGSYALDPHYRLPYVQAWNVDVQKTLPWGVVLNAGYNGSKGQDLDIRSAPRRSISSPNTNYNSSAGLPNTIFTYEQAGAFSRFNAGTLRVNKRLTHGLSIGANYQYSHSIDDASSVGGNSTVVAQNWQNIFAEESNSSFDQRHRVSGNYLYELPFGKDKLWLTGGAGSHILEGFSVSGSFTFATGMALTPSYVAAVSDVAHGTAGTLRPNRDYTQSITAGGGSAAHWFNTAVFSLPTPDAYGNAFGNASRNSIPGPGTVSNNMSLSKTMQLGGTRSMEMRATANNVFNTVQYAGVGTSLGMPTFGKVTSAGSMRSFQFTARFRF